MTRFTYLLAIGAAAMGLGAATAAGATRPDDRPNHGPGAQAAHTAGGETVRPDDRAWRGAGPVPTVEVLTSPRASVDGFDWADAGIGAAAALGLGLLLAGASAAVLRRHQVATFTVAVVSVAALTGGALAAWSPAQKLDELGGHSAEVNTPSLDGCPIQSPDGLSLYMASNRPGGRGGLDIWVATRASAAAPWGAPVNLGEPVNSAADDFCPTPVGARGLFFVSREALPGACGQGDIYYTHRRTGGEWVEPERLLCAPAGPNSELDEQGPSWVDASKGRLRGKKLLYFSRSSAAPNVPGELYVSERQNGARFGPGTAVAELNDPSANDIQPNVRTDGLEVVFSSNRSGTLGGQDVWIATRASIGEPFSAPVNAGAAVNTSAGETRPSLSNDGKQLLFGRAPGPEGSSDIYVTSR
jgi:hypothetical protein